MINLIDSMLVLRDFVFNDKSYTKEEFLNLLKNNDEEFLNKCKKYKTCFGIDDGKVNEFSKKISSEIFSTLNDKKVAFGEGFLPASIQFKAQADAGKIVGATPDGRKAGTPLCDSLGAIFGKDVKGATALLKSVTSLDLKKALGVPVLNFNINPDFKNEVLKGLILGYMKLGGVQIQITCISREILEKALENPDDYRNLVVRVGGFSEYYSRLSYDMKIMILNRTIQEGV
jgi:formate C-acetyltransferase